MRYPTASRLERAFACHASAVLPQGVRLESPAGARGVAVHRYLELIPSLGREPALAAVPKEHRELCSAIDTATLPLNAQAYRAEVMIGWNPTTNETYVGDSNRPDFPDGWLEGRVDVLASSPDDPPLALIADYKTGYGYVEAPEHNRQMRGLALIAWKALRARAVVTWILLLGDQGQVRLRLAHEFDGPALEAIEAETRKLLLRLSTLAELEAAGKPVPVVMGDHCRFCPAFACCPGQTALVRALGASPEAVATEIREALTPSTAAVAYRKLAAAKALLRAVEEAIDRAAVEFGGIDLGDGRVYGPVRSVREELDGSVTWTVLKDLHGHATADEAVSLKATKESVTEALRTLRSRLAEQDGGKAPLLKDLVEPAFEALRTTGAIQVKEREELRVHRAR